MPKLSRAQCKHLRGLAHSLQPAVRVGAKGITDALIAAIDAALTTHELVKVRLQEPEDKKAMAAELAVRADAALCGLIGHTVILYRENPEAPVIRLPARA